jgi:hypothetical protein
LEDLWKDLWEDLWKTSGSKSQARGAEVDRDFWKFRERILGKEFFEDGKEFLGNLEKI